MLLASAPFQERSLLSSRPTSRAHDRSLCQGDPTGRKILTTHQGIASSHRTEHRRLEVLFRNRLQLAERNPVTRSSDTASEHYNLKVNDKPTKGPRTRFNTHTGGLGLPQYGPTRTRCHKWPGCVIPHSQVGKHPTYYTSKSHRTLKVTTNSPISQGISRKRHHTVVTHSYWTSPQRHSRCQQRLTVYYGEQ